MAYLIKTDYYRLIQDANLQQILDNDVTIQNGTELAAQAEAISHLQQKYDVAAEFTDTRVWKSNHTYVAGDRVYLDAPAWVSATHYTVGTTTLYNNSVYICITDNTDATFTSAHWTNLGFQYTIFSAQYPYGQFDLYSSYKIGDAVWYKNNIYTCRIATAILDHQTALQYNMTQNLPYPNIFPDDIQSGLQYWGTPTSYVITPGTLPTDSAWIQIDTRDQQLVQKLVDITLYHLMRRIAPRNIPQIRIDAYMGMPDMVKMGETGPIFPVYSALGWLQACARGEITPNLPLIQPAKGRRIRFGGKVLGINTY